MPTNLTFERKLTVGDVLTSTTIAVSVISALLSWHADRQLNRKGQADQIRSAAATTLAKMDRWQELSLSFFDDALVVYDNVKAHLASKFDVVDARNYLYRNLLEAQVRVKQKELDDHVELGYVNFFAYDPRSRLEFQRLFELLEQDQQEAFNRTLSQTETTVLSRQGENPKTFNPAALYVDLQVSSEAEKTKYQAKIQKDLQGVGSRLLRVIAEEDDELLDHPAIAFTSTK